MEVEEEVVALVRGRQCARTRGPRMAVVFIVDTMVGIAIDRSKNPGQGTPSIMHTCNKARRPDYPDMYMTA